jgi:uncharacterized protein (DUF1330 family)
MAHPAFLFIELADEHADQAGLLRRAASAVSAAGGEVLASAPSGRVACLEPGSRGAGMLLARWPDAAVVRDVATGTIVPLLGAALPRQTAPLVLQVSGLPVDGLPDMMNIPTVASVPLAPRIPRNALMVIRGSVSDQARIDTYRDVILPMLKERGGYYEVFAAQPGEVVAHAGRWTEQVFIVSRWPCRESAEDFWYCDRYQVVAIPRRIGAGKFTVHLVDAAE